MIHHSYISGTHKHRNTCCKGGDDRRTRARRGRSEVGRIKMELYRDVVRDPPRLRPASSPRSLFSTLIWMSAVSFQTSSLQSIFKYLI